MIAVTDLEMGIDVTDAPSWAIVRGIGTTYTAAAVLIAVGAVLALIAFRLDRRQQARQGAEVIA